MTMDWEHDICTLHGSGQKEIADRLYGELVRLTARVAELVELHCQVNLGLNERTGELAAERHRVAELETAASDLTRIWKRVEDDRALVFLSDLQAFAALLPGCCSLKTPHSHSPSGHVRLNYDQIESGQRGEGVSDG